ncbi:MAG: hypothetical protein KDC38_13555, partial [Planctomycetes bacterium]|nr:hypothetical protein [Planctomycetota bacterium]
RIDDSIRLEGVAIAVKDAHQNGLSSSCEPLCESALVRIRGILSSAPELAGSAALESRLSDLDHVESMANSSRCSRGPEWRQLAVELLTPPPFDDGRPLGVRAREADERLELLARHDPAEHKCLLGVELPRHALRCLELQDEYLDAMLFSDAADLEFLPYLAHLESSREEFSSTPGALELARDRVRREVPDKTEQVLRSRAQELAEYLAAPDAVALRPEVEEEFRDTCAALLESAFRQHSPNVENALAAVQSLESLFGELTSDYGLEARIWSQEDDTGSLLPPSFVTELFAELYPRDKKCDEMLTGAAVMLSTGDESPLAGTLSAIGLHASRNLTDDIAGRRKAHDLDPLHDALRVCDILASTARALPEGGSLATQWSEAANELRSDSIAAIEETRDSAVAFLEDDRKGNRDKGSQLLRDLAELVSGSRECRAEYARVLPDLCEQLTRHFDSLAAKWRAIDNPSHRPDYAEEYRIALDWAERWRKETDDDFGTALTHLIETRMIYCDDMVRYCEAQFRAPEAHPRGTGKINGKWPSERDVDDARDELAKTRSDVDELRRLGLDHLAGKVDEFSTRLQVLSDRLTATEPPPERRGGVGDRR